MAEALQPVILIIEDDVGIHRFLKISLEAHNYKLVASLTAKDGLMQAASRSPDVVIVDLGLPDLDGVEVVKQIRQWSTVPIVVVSARGKEEDKVTALDAGADDYLTKPFSVGELMARLRAVMRRVPQLQEEEMTYRSGPLEVDISARRVHLNGVETHLTPNEFKLLTYLIRHAGRVVTHQQLLKEIWGPDSVQETHYLRVYVNQLRQKIEPAPAQPRYLLTDPGVGYRFTPADG